LLDFLGGPAFADNPHWRTCFCFFYHFAGDGDAWQARTGDQNRAAKAARIATGRAHGVLAYREGDVVGWVHAAPRSDLDAFTQWGEPEDARQGLIVCYVVHPEHRGSGVATALLAEATAMLRDLGLDYVDALPLKELKPKEGLPDSALIYHGPRSMYEAAGFTVVEEPPDSPFVRMRLPLR
jgi:GNAT superfamily N-acetyltransferase